MATTLFHPHPSFHDPLADESDFAAANPIFYMLIAIAALLLGAYAWWDHVNPSDDPALSESLVSIMSDTASVA